MVLGLRVQTNQIRAISVPQPGLSLATNVPHWFWLGFGPLLVSVLMKPVSISLDASVWRNQWEYSATTPGSPFSSHPISRVLSTQKQVLELREYHSNLLTASWTLLLMISAQSHLLISSVEPFWKLSWNHYPGPPISQVWQIIAISMLKRIPVWQNPFTQGMYYGFPY